MDVEPQTNVHASTRKHKVKPVIGEPTMDQKSLNGPAPSAPPYAGPGDAVVAHIPSDASREGNAAAYSEPAGAGTTDGNEPLLATSQPAPPRVIWGFSLPVFIVLVLGLVLCGVSLIVGTVSLTVGFGPKIGPTHTATPSFSSSKSISDSPSITPSNSPPLSVSPTISRTHSQSVTPVPSDLPNFVFWNGPGKNSSWYDALDVNVNVSFVTQSTATYEVEVQVDWADHNAIELFANPQFLKVRRLDGLVPPPVGGFLTDFWACAPAMLPLFTSAPCAATVTVPRIASPFLPHTSLTPRPFFSLPLLFIR